MKISILNGTDMKSNSVEPAYNGSNEVLNSSNEVLNASNEVMNGNEVDYFLEQFAMNCPCMNGWTDEDTDVFNGLDEDTQQAFELAVQFGDPDAIAMNGLGKWLKNASKKAGAFIKDASKVVTGVLKTYAGLTTPEAAPVAAEMDTQLRGIGIDPNPQIVAVKAQQLVDSGQFAPRSTGPEVTEASKNTWVLPAVAGLLGLGIIAAVSGRSGGRGKK